MVTKLLQCSGIYLLYIKLLNTEYEVQIRVYIDIMWLPYAAL